MNFQGEQKVPSAVPPCEAPAAVFDMSAEAAERLEEVITQRRLLQNGINE